METTKTDRLFEFAKHKGYSFTDLAAILHLKKTAGVELEKQQSTRSRKAFIKNN